MYRIHRLHHETLLKLSYMIVAPILAKRLVKLISHAYDAMVYVTMAQSISSSDIQNLPGHSFNP